MGEMKQVPYQGPTYTLGANVQNLVAVATWITGLMPPCIDKMNTCHLHKAVANISCFQKLRTMLASNFSAINPVHSGVL